MKNKLVLVKEVLLVISFACGLLYCLNIIKNYRLNKKVTSDIFSEINFGKPLEEVDGFRRYDLFIEDKSMREITSIVNKAMEKGTLTDDLKKWCPAIFIYNNKKHHVKIRVRGDTSDHWASKKKSWRIKFKQGEAFDGIKELNLIIPHDKGVNEMVHNIILEDSELIYPRDRLIVLNINKKSFGLYRQVEHISAEMLSHYKKTESCIIGSTDHWIHTYKNNVQVGMPLYTYDMLWLPEHYKNYLKENQYTALAWNTFDRLSNAIRYPDKDSLSIIHDTIDLDLYKKYFINVLLSGTVHADIGSYNIKYYHNPLSGKFEPVGWDFGIQPRPDWGQTIDVCRVLPSFRKLILKDELFTLERDRTVYDFLSKHEDRGLKYYLTNRFFEKYDFTYNLLQKSPVGKDVLNRLNTSLDIMQKNATYIKHLYEYNSVSVRLYPTQTPLRYNLIIAPEMHSPISLDSIYFNEQQLPLLNIDGVKISKPLVRCDRIFTNSQRTSGRYKTDMYFEGFLSKLKEHHFLIDFSHQSQVNQWKELKFNFINEITGKTIPQKEIYLYANKNYIAKGTSDNLENFKTSCKDFKITFKIDQQKNVCSIKKGNYKITEIITFPKDWVLHIEEGTEFIFEEGASFISYSPVIAKGSKQLPIKISAAPGISQFGVFAVIHTNDKEMSSFEHAHFSTGSRCYLDQRLFSGMLSIYHGSANVNHCRFQFARGEDDGLNIKYGKVNIHHNFFYKNESDAIDLDFCEGVVENNHFSSNAGDSIDTSGSNVFISKNFISQSGDKGISIGEASHVKTNSNYLEYNMIGIAIKDLSTHQSTADIFHKNNTALSAYQKKEQFGGSTSTISHPRFFNNSQKVFTDQYSKITVSNELNISSMKNLDEMLSKTNFYQVDFLSP